MPECMCPFSDPTCDWPIVVDLIMSALGDGLAPMSEALAVDLTSETRILIGQWRLTPFLKLAPPHQALAVDLLSSTRRLIM